MSDLSSFMSLVKKLNQNGPKDVSILEFQATSRVNFYFDPAYHQSGQKESAQCSNVSPWSIFHLLLLMNAVHIAEAWHVVKTIDPLIDSDDEDMSDYNMRVDISEESSRHSVRRFLTCCYFFSFIPARRLDVLSRIRKLSPTPL
jgi:hypothetical protein